MDVSTNIYLGTLGMEGTFEAMGNGNVDLNCLLDAATSDLWRDNIK